MCRQFGKLAVLDMRILSIASVFILFCLRDVGADEEGDIDQIYQNNCYKVPFSGFPRYFIEAVGDNWFLRSCPRDSEFSVRMCGCRRKRLLLVEKITRQYLPVTEAPPPPITTTTTTTIRPIVKKQIPSVGVISTSTTALSLTTPLPTTKKTTTTTTTTTTTKTTSTITVPTTREATIEISMSTNQKKICEGCTLERGVGYVQHESDCNKYVMCYPVGNNGTLKGEVRQCSVGQYWDQYALTCRASTEVTCKTDKCALDPSLQTYSFEGDCRGYWKCEKGVSVGNCCPRGQVYVAGVGCREDMSCNSKCDSKDIISGCDKRAVDGNPSKFQQVIHGDKLVQMDCPPGLVFINNKCKCDYKTNQHVQLTTKVCKKELDLDFESGVKDKSGNQVHVEAVNVTISNGIACFFGDGALIVPRFANVDIGDDLEIKVRYLLHQTDTRHPMPQALVYNGDCDYTTTMVAAVDTTGTYFGLNNKLDVYKHVAVENKSMKRWVDAKYSLHQNVMRAVINGNAKSTKFYGSLARSRCGLKIGWGKDFKSFDGCIDEISISFCQTENR